ncbi:MAG TPA: energy transducer TonB [Bacteroidales bacterium]|nr:energy transducer TonB [Bacteroidales bacterium]
MFDNFRDIMNFDEELFEKRNKEYGAYQLRKRYNGVMTTSVITAIIIFSLAVVLPFVMRPRNEKVLAGGYGYTTVSMEKFEPPEDIYVPPAAPPPPPARAEEIVRYVPPEVVDSVTPFEPTLATPEELSEIPEDTNLDLMGTGSGDNLMGVEGGVPTDEPFFFVEQMPTFKGGDINKFRLWVQQRTNYPQEAIDKKIRGQVLLTFIVETDGSISNVTIIKGVDPLIDAEAVKAIESSPKWTPGFQRGQPVRVRYAIPLNFTL